MGNLRRHFPLISVKKLQLQETKNTRLEKRIKQKKNHFPSFVISSEVRRRLTVFDGVEEGAARVEGREEEEARVDGDAGGDERDLLEVVEVARAVGLALGGEDDEEDEEEEDGEGLDASAQSLEENRHKYESDFAVHDDALPVVGVGAVAIEEEAVLALDISVLELIS